MPNTTYDNFFLSNEIEDQFNSHLNLMRFCTIDNSLEGTAGMKRMVNVYAATNGTEKLTKGKGNTKAIEVGFTQREYEILLAQNHFDWYDEEAMTDPMIVPTGIRHCGTDMFNTVQGDIFGEFKKATLSVSADTFDFNAFVDAVAMLDMENQEGVEIFGFVSSKAKAEVRKALKDDLKYVEAFVRSGYIGTVNGVNLYDKKDADDTEICIGTKQAVTVFNKKGVEIERIGKNNRSSEDANVRKNSVFNRKYYFPALTNETRAVKIVIPDTV